MKRKIFTFLLIFISLLSFLGGKTLAQVFPKSFIEKENLQQEKKAEATWPGRENRFKKIQEKTRKRIERFKERKEKIATRWATVRERFSRVRRKRILKFWHRMLRRLKAALHRLERVVERIASRIEKLKTRGVDTAKAEEKLARAREEIQVAKQTLAEAEEKFEQIFVSDNPKEIFLQVRALVYEVKESLKKAHRALVEVIISLKKLRPTP